jgi:hypothetical protein
LDVAWLCWFGKNAFEFRACNRKFASDKKGFNEGDNNRNIHNMISLEIENGQ